MKRAVIFVIFMVLYGQLYACNGPMDYTTLFISAREAEESKRLKACNDQRLIEQFNLLRTLHNKKSKKDCRIEVRYLSGYDREAEE